MPDALALIGPGRAVVGRIRHVCRHPTFSCLLSFENTFRNIMK
ncbi:hypothetical protein CIT292_08315 [Citrobacter youngae ATCC 29220]|uniref:Uncharacterized protein n=1 Tax=Citrobacter youngae ATCC 29220 TaxID=500640 RepID=D4BCV0_9ENTR|nr:hypothetical protein CIT292_08315 [Citrobacter youngae ATCC 29220]